MPRIAVDFWVLDIRLELAWLRDYLAVTEVHLRELPSQPPASLCDALEDPDEDYWRPAERQWVLPRVVAPSLERGHI